MCVPKIRRGFRFIRLQTFQPLTLTPRHKEEFSLIVLEISGRFFEGEQRMCFVVRLCVCTFSVYVCLFVFVCVPMYVCVCLRFLCVSLRLRVHICVCSNVCVWMHECVCVDVCAYMCICVTEYALGIYPKTQKESQWYPYRTEGEKEKGQEKKKVIKSSS